MNTPVTTDEYLAMLPIQQKVALEKLRSTIKSTAPSAQEAISSGVPAFRYKGKYLVSFGASKRHVSLYVMRGSALELMKEKLKFYDTSNTVVRFTPDSPLPASIVKQIVNARIKEIEAKLSTNNQ